MFLQSDTLFLRAPELSDLDFLCHIENDTRQWCVSGCKTPYSRYLLQQYIETNTHDIYIDRQERLMVEHRESGQLIGAVDFIDFNPSARRAEVGIVIDESFRGKGYGKASLALLCEYAEQVLDLHQLYAYIFLDNMAARHLFASSEFSEVAVLPDWVFWNRRYYSVCLCQRIFEK